MDKKVYELIDSYRDEFVSVMQKWIRIPSVKGEAEDGAPFGREVRNMLDTAVADAEAMGFKTRVFDGYACDITLGDPEEQIAVLGHLDVVPAGDGWETDPFDPVIKGNKMYGRGTGDDKGPSLVSLFALKAIKEAGIPLKKGIRLIFGCDEESGWDDMAYYCAHTEMPEMGFSPDAAFPVINTEKGMVHLKLHAPVDTENLKVLEFHTGERLNVIPGISRVLLEGGDELVLKVKAYAEKTGLPYTAEATEKGVLVTAEGIPGHSAYPTGCRNAIGMVLLLLKELGVTGALRTLADTVGMSHDGEGLGNKMEDSVSGPLTCNMGILHVDDGKLFAALDYRCPVTADLEAVRDNTIAHLPGFTVEVSSMKEPHHVPEDSELVSNLLAAYTEETGLEGRGIPTGGGTYAKIMKQGVAFGAGFPDDEDLAHQANEYIDIDKMMTTMKIYANALIRLAGE